MIKLFTQFMIHGMGLDLHSHYHPRIGLRNYKENHMVRLKGHKHKEQSKNKTCKFSECSYHTTFYGMLLCSVLLNISTSSISSHKYLLAFCLQNAKCHRTLGPYQGQPFALDLDLQSTQVSYLALAKCRTLESLKIKNGKGSNLKLISYCLPAVHQSCHKSACLL